MSIFMPDRYVMDVSVIDLDQLYASGKRVILLDRDNTIVPRDTGIAPKYARDWINKANALGITVFFVSNNWHIEQVEASSSALGCKFIARAMKPFPLAFYKVLKSMNLTKSQAVVVGDQLYTDILGGRWGGIDSIYVEPQSSEDLWYTKIFRKWERSVLKERIPETNN